MFTKEHTNQPPETRKNDVEQQIPEPAGLPLLGNIMALDSEFPLGSMKALSDEYGEIYRLRFPDRTVVIVSTQALVNETCNEKRFKKSINTALKEIRAGIHDGLFTAYMGEENWGIAHRILMPAFGPLSIQGMFDDMHDIASQLALKWARQGSSFFIPVTDDFTRLTLDTLALCAMGYRFNSYYSPELHPFIEAMGDFLTEAGEKPRRLPLPSMFYGTKDRKYEADIDVMRNTAKEVLEARKVSEDPRHDLLNAMLKGVDSKTGKKMTDESIMDNLITFLIAGHETTSGLLSFAFYQLCTHPEAYRKAQQEIDEVVGQGAIEVKHMSRLPYISAILRETLRLNATIPLFTVESFEDTVIGGKYHVKAGETIVNLLAKSQLDPKVFGDSANEFRPERMLDEPFERVQAEYPNCWKPFGNGMRGCIGRPFAWQESLLVMAMLLQNFNFVLEPAYKLGYKQTLTIKPKDLTMRAILRDGLDAASLQRRLAGQSIVKGDMASEKKDVASEGEKIPMTVLYGSNSGTCEALAQRVASDAPTHGFQATKVDCLDSANENLPMDQPVVIITASYEGQPPDNAGHFVQWLEETKTEDAPLKNVSYSLFGCGDKNWAQTFHRIPKLMNDKLQNLGAEPVAGLGLSDVSQGQVFTDFENWEDTILWPAMIARYDAKASSRNEASGIDVSISTPRASTLRQEVAEGEVTDTKVLVADKEGNVLKKHIEVQLPNDMSYSAGDYLVVLPFNPVETVNRVLRRFHLARDSQLEIRTNVPTSLPTNSALSAHDTLSSYVELSQPATKRNILTLAKFAKDEATKVRLARLEDEDFTSEISMKRVSILNLLEQFHDIELPFATFIGMLPPMRVRQYSISSSPLNRPSHATISFSILQAPAHTGNGTHLGVATSYLSSLSRGDKIQLAIRASPAAFSVPNNPGETPLICIAAGTGIAPFRGFMQERAAQRAAGRDLAPALLFFGCRSTGDDLYRGELDQWEKDGVVEVKRAYSRQPEKTEGCRYVQDRMMKEKVTAVKLWRAGAKIYVCGSRGIADSVREAVITIKKTALMEDGKESEVPDVEKWFDELRNVRYVIDVFD